MEKAKAIEGLKTALQTELNGIEFYRAAAQRTEDLSCLTPDSAAVYLARSCLPPQHQESPA